MSVLKVKRINFYLFNQLIKFFSLILFIFLSVSWILQLTRLFTITNFIQIDTFDVVILSLYLIPNIITVIIPFIIIFGLLLCFNKLNKDNELIAILSLGFGLKPFKKTLIIFSLLIIIIVSFLNFYLAPTIYKIYKIEEFQLRNNLDFDKIIYSNFINLDKTTILDFKKENNNYKDIFISFNDDKENIIFAKKGKIYSKDNSFNFQLTDGFKISFNQETQIEKLEFQNYILNIKSNSKNNNIAVDKNTFTIFDDLNAKNYLNITFKFIDIVLIIFVISIFYTNNLKRISFNSKNNILYSLICISVLIINQILKNSDILIMNYLLIILLIISFLSLISFFKKI